ncbi:MAG TPA: ABC transporter ATP-binding protein [Candidatus Limnocylindria bacterium]|nr:ABC transporter ATP-binding protein [Candidatus Limnocylindria bacterium]
MATVHLESVTKRYGATMAVQDFSLDVRDGELVTLLGPSGCGKTTTLRMVAGLIEPTSGRILFDGRDVTFVPPRKRNIGFVFQTPALFPHLSVADNVAFGLSVKGQRKDVIRDRVDTMLALVDLAGYGKRIPSQLSGGQQQRVALARVLATDPTVLLFDEPLSALDKNLRDSLKYSILDLQRKTRKTAIYVTHDQSEAFAISDRIVVMNAGRAEQIGTQTDIYLHPETPFVAEFIGANNGMAGTVTVVDDIGDESRITFVADGLTLHSRGRPGLAVGQAVVGYVRPENVIVLGETDGDGYDNVVEGVIDRLIFEGATAQLRVDVGGRELRADVTGNQRLTLMQRQGRVRLGFSEVTLIPAKP